MSREDRERWNARYADGAFADRTWPSALLAEWLDRLPRGRALDLACGAGRNALFLARNGFEVDAVDVSGVALERGAATARATGVAVRWIEADLETTAPPVHGPYQLIVLFRYVNAALVARLHAMLAPGGHIIVEQHLDDAGASGGAGPANTAFRVAPGALASALEGLEILYGSEGPVVDPDGREMLLARIVARATENPITG